MSLVNNALPEGALPPVDSWPDISSQKELGYGEVINVCDCLLDSHIRSGFGDHIAIEFEGQRISYAELLDRVERLANALLELDFSVGQRLLIYLPNRPEFIETWLATVRIGGVAVAVNHLYRTRELTHIFVDVEPAVIITTPELLDAIQYCVPPDVHAIVISNAKGETSKYELVINESRPNCSPAATSVDDLAIIAYTSGTTGSPKGTCHSHGELLAIADTYALDILRPTPSDKFMSHASLAFTYGLGSSLVFPFRFGATVVLDSERFEAKRCLENIRRTAPTLFFSTPAALRRIIADANSSDSEIWQSVRLVISAGENLSKNLFEEWQATTNTAVLDGCGSTEMLHIWLSQRTNRRVPGSTGKPVNLFDIRLIDRSNDSTVDGPGVGIAEVRGPTGCVYWRGSDLQTETVKSGWTRTGDVFERDEVGDYWYVGRFDNLIIHKGYNVSPVEVEDLLTSYPGVMESAVVGIATAEGDTNIAALLVVSPSATEDSISLAQRIQEFLRERLAPYKCPNTITFGTALPRTATGKIDRTAISIIAKERQNALRPNP